jgi:uncharacterized damage-inducible protein DinB
MASELETFLRVWDEEAKKTAALLQALPEGCYDFRPDAGGRSVGELAWHLAESDAYTSVLVEQRAFDMSSRPPGIERPRTIAELAPGFERVHADAVARIRQLKPEDLGATARYFDGSERAIGSILWEGIVFHLIHHRGQLSLLCRLAGGTGPGMYGPNREETAAMRAAQKAQAAETEAAAQAS